MPTSPPTTGHGATLTFDSLTLSLYFTSFSPSEMTRPDLDKSHLGTNVFREFMPGDLIDAGAFTASFFTDTSKFTMHDGSPTGAPTWGATVATYDTGTPRIDGPVYVATITLPIAVSGNTIAAKIIGKAYFNSLSLPELATDTLLQQSAVLKWADGPALVPEAA